MSSLVYNVYMAQNQALEKKKDKKFKGILALKYQRLKRLIHDINNMKEREKKNPGQAGNPAAIE